ncbi:MAG: peroxiredoxin [Alphaproteobacteria bacterium]|nr:peroxiredoxin [Alphaproteobacteria bacterium]
MPADPMSLINSPLPSSLMWMTMRQGSPQPVGADALAEGKWVLIGVPGAFTPTCHARHLPGFVDNMKAFADRSVRVAFMTTNDVFVTDAWGKANNVGDDVLMLADPDNSVSMALHLSLDLSAAKLGMRTQRFAMTIDNGVITSLAIDSGGSFEKTSAESVLAAL